MHKRHEAIRTAVAQFKSSPDVGRWKVGDTEVAVWQDADGYWLTVTTHGNEILEAVRTPDGSINVKVRTKGWATMLTANVLNAALMGLGILNRVHKRGDKLFFVDILIPEDSWLLI